MIEHAVLDMPVRTDSADDLNSFLSTITNRILEDGVGVTREEAARIAAIPIEDAMQLFHYAGKIRKQFRSDVISMCSIVNAKSGNCSEDCVFCSQSAHFKTQAPTYELMSPEEVVAVAKQAKADGAESFGIVISGYGIKKEKEKLAVGEMVKAIKREVDIEVHGSFGILDQDVVDYMVECGVSQINHNLETSQRMYPEMCTTHSFQDRIDTLKHVRNSGIKLCSGGIFGMGETKEDRVDMAFSLRELDVETVPMNFLHRIDGTPMKSTNPLEPMECLMIISLYRFILPKVELKVCGGRETNLRDLQSMIFFAGADSMMVGNYLTTAGREPEADRQMMKDLGLKWTTQ